jgi:hypothetical protein
LSSEARCVGIGEDGILLFWCYLWEGESGEKKGREGRKKRKRSQAATSSKLVLKRESGRRKKGRRRTYWSSDAKVGLTRYQ